MLVTQGPARPTAPARSLNLFVRRPVTAFQPGDPRRHPFGLFRAALDQWAKRVPLGRAAAWAYGVLFAITAVALWQDYPRVAAVIGANLFGLLMLHLWRRGRAA